MNNDVDSPDSLKNWTAPPLPPREAMEGQFARLEPLCADHHAAQIFAANSEDSDARMWRYLPQEPFASQAAYHRWVKSTEDDPDQMFFAIKNLETGKFCGVLSYLRMQPDAGSIEVGNIAFSPPLQRTRAATEAIVLTARRAFALGYRRFEWKCNAANVPSRRAAMRYGFSYEGIFRQAAVVKGRNRDTAWFAMIDKEFPKIDAAYSTWLDAANFSDDGQQVQRLSDLTASILVAQDPMFTA